MAHDAFGAVAELAASQHGVVSSLQAAALGVRPSTLQSWRRRGRIWPMFPGSFAVAGVPLTWRSHLAAVTLARDGRSVVVSHRAAARLHGLDGVHGAWKEITIDMNTRFRPAGFVVHRTDTLVPDDVVHLDGIRVTSVARTLADLGAVVDDDTVWKAVDHALRLGVRARWLTEVLRRVERPGPSGTGSLRRVLERQRDLGRTDSWFETLVLDQLRRHPAIPDVVPQYPLHRDDGSLVAVVDAAIPSARVAVEAHSRRFHDGHRAGVLDAERQYRIELLGWRVVFVTFDDARARRVGEKVARYLASVA
jgi:hypothetical protein